MIQSYFLNGYLFGLDPIWLTVLGLAFILIMTTLGAALVFAFRKKISNTLQKIFLGFAAGVMLAAAIWSLIIPAIEVAEEQGMAGWIPAIFGIIAGALFLLLLDNLLPHLHINSDTPEGMQSSLKRTTLLYLAITLHNIPESLAVGFAFGLALSDGSPASMAAAIGLAIGIGLHNFPEGAAVTLPFVEAGFSKKKAFLIGASSGIIEPIFAALGLLLALQLGAIMPWFLAFAAGAMIFVIVEELIPEAKLGEHSHLGTFSVMAGFLLMLLLDILLG